MISKVDYEGHHYWVLTEVTDHDRDDSIITKVNGFINSIHRNLNFKLLMRKHLYREIFCTDRSSDGLSTITVNPNTLTHQFSWVWWSQGTPASCPCYIESWPDMEPQSTVYVWLYVSVIVISVSFIISTSAFAA